MTVEPVIDIATAAQILGVPKSWVYARVERKDKCDLPHYRFGRYVRFRASELEEWMQANAGGPKR